MIRWTGWSRIKIKIKSTEDDQSNKQDQFFFYFFYQALGRVSLVWMVSGGWSGWIKWSNYLPPQPYPLIHLFFFCWISTINQPFFDGEPCWSSRFEVDYLTNYDDVESVSTVLMVSKKRGSSLVGSLFFRPVRLLIRSI